MQLGVICEAMARDEREGMSGVARGAIGTLAIGVAFYLGVYLQHLQNSPVVRGGKVAVEKCIANVDTEGILIATACVVVAPDPFSEKGLRRCIWAEGNGMGAGLDCIPKPSPSPAAPQQEEAE